MGTIAEHEFQAIASWLGGATPASAGGIQKFVDFTRTRRRDALDQVRAEGAKRTSRAADSRLQEILSRGMLTHEISG